MILYTGITIVTVASSALAGQSLARKLRLSSSATQNKMANRYIARQVVFWVQHSHSSLISCSTNSTKHGQILSSHLSLSSWSPFLKYVAIFEPSHATYWEVNERWALYFYGRQGAGSLISSCRNKYRRNIIMLPSCSTLHSISMYAGGTTIYPPVPNPHKKGTSCGSRKVMSTS